ncbi:extracellular solute-binding protein [uncultured Jannaschia sp.]|uniref:extracellular solute-binding protein n=1 Tax=uncultured Jannaschia sp. TaxID=293347 RepID=UPI002617B5DC|nr:extracellular solute-binding protein [uncultured Jannaschia sp.]
MLARAAAIAILAAAPAAAQENVTVSHGYTNFGELKYGPDEVLAYVNPDAPKGGEISLATLATFDSFNPYARKGVAESTAADLVYERIMFSAADDPYGTYCYLCTTIEYPDDLEWLIINLREDVTFSDGTPMTAEDVVFTANLFLEQGIPEFRQAIGNFFSKIEATGPYQVRYEFGPDADFRTRVAQSGAWVAWSKAWFEESGQRLDDSSDRPFLGTGPYVLDRVDMGRNVVYRKDPDWWGADVPSNVGRHNFDAVRIEAFLDQTAALEAFKAGEYTVRTPGSAREWAVDYNFPAVERGDVIAETIPDGGIDAARGLAFNLRREKWQDPRVRDAVRMLFNFEWSNETLFNGLYERPYSVWGNSDLAADGPPTPGELAVLEPLVAEGLLDEAILTEDAVMPPVSDPSGNAPDRRTRREATRLLAEAGWTVGDDGLLRNEAGETLTLSIIQFDANLDRVMNPFIQNLRLVGIDASLRRTDTSQYVELRRNRDWDLSNIIPGQGYEPGPGLVQWFGSETREDSSRNIMGLADPAVDSLIESVVVSDTLDDLRDRTRALDRVLRAHGFWLAQWENRDIWVAYWNQYGRPDPLPPLAVGLLDFWWYEAEKAEALRASGAL